MTTVDARDSGIAVQLLCIQQHSRILLSIFMSNAVRRVSSDLDSDHFSEAYVSIGTIKVQ